MAPHREDDSTADHFNTPHSNVIDTSPTSRHSDSSIDNRESPSWNSPTSGFPSSEMNPPRYSLVHPYRSLTPTREASNAAGFGVVGDPQAHEFIYSYPIRPKKPWATLHLHTRVQVPGNLNSLQNQPKVPRIWSCDPITGTLQLDLDSPQNIKQITIMLNGSVIMSSRPAGTLQFLAREFTLWDKSMGNPLRSGIADSKGTQEKTFNGRLGSGQYTFPFSFPFPTHADPISKSAVLNTSSISPSPPGPHTVGTGVESQPPQYDYGTKDTERAPRIVPPRSTSSVGSPANETPLVTPIPQTFMERDINPNVAYNISVNIVHGLFKASSKIKTNIAYIPASEPLRASQKRREAYEAGGLLPSPMDNPEGWFALQTTTTHGVVRINESLLHTSVDCTLYIAQPLSYTRGSVIPCFITIHSDSVDVEYLLSSTEFPTSRLLRHVRHPMTQSNNPGPGYPTMYSSSWDHVMTPTSDMKLVTHEVGSAKWWIPPKDVVQSATVRNLEGEIHLDPGLQPSCDFQLFSVEYVVELLSFRTANFKPVTRPPLPGEIRSGDGIGMASTRVEVTTLCRLDGPVPTVYSEPPTTYQMRCLSD